MHEFEWNVKHITGWIFDILIYWAISHRNSWSPQLDFIPLVLHHICHQFTPCSFHSYEPASQERLVVARAVKNCLHADTETVSRGLSRSKQSLRCSNLPQDLTSLFSGVRRHLLTADVWEQMSFSTAAGKGPQPGAKRGSSTASNHAATASDSSARREAFAQAETSHPKDMCTAGSRAGPQHRGALGVWCTPGPTSLPSWNQRGSSSGGERCKQHCDAAVRTKGSCSLQVFSLFLLLHTQGPNKSWNPPSSDQRHRGNMHVERN